MWWSEYIGKPWSKDKDCFWWFREWRKNHFNSTPPDVNAAGRSEIHNACLLMSDSAGYEMGWHKTDHPVEGDAVTMSFSKVPHHIGMVVMVTKRLHVLHAVENGSVTVSNLVNLKSNGINIVGYWTPCK